mgnify:FL=1
MKLTAIIVTFNRPDALEVILQSISNQKTLPDEVIIADDGSSPETLNVITKIKDNFPISIKHVWHENNGFRAASIRNKAIKESSGECLVFSDGDLIFHPYFFYDLKNHIKSGTALIGSRVFFKENSTQKILETKQIPRITSFFSKHIEQNRLNSIRFPRLGRLISRSGFSRNLRGGLLCVWKKDILLVNGWNEDFTGWGMEDTELVARVYHTGLTLKKLKLAGITYHLWHPLLNRKRVKKNEILLYECIEKKTIWIKNGLVKTEKP